jgi:hypothetical protein
MKNDSPPNFNDDWDVNRIMSESDIEQRSLCSSCKHAGDCAFQKERQKPAFYCEEFEIDTRPLEEKAEKEKPSPAISIDVGETDSDQFIGLCSNCANRKTCAFPKPEGGVWHCEEYQ